MAIHLGFDMGIRNLAYCLIQHNADSWLILDWNNIDLLENGVSSQIAKQCVACTGPAKYISNDKKRWCKGCATGIRRKKTATEKPSQSIIPCTLDAKALRVYAISKGIENAKKKKKEELLHDLSLLHLMPWKPAKTMDTSLSDIRRAMDTWLNSVLPTFSKSTLIRLENQPVMKGPTMKSVQIILFTLLCHRLEREYDWKGRIEFVHAGTKSKHETSEVPPVAPAVSQTEGAAYRARKKTAESDVAEILTKVGSSWLPFFQLRSKKSDLADALLMALRS